MPKGRRAARSAAGRGGRGSGATELDDAEVGFAKLQGEDFEYYMQSYSIILGRNSKKSEVDVDLASLGGGMNISRHHARIFYDFPRRRFALEVMGKNGCVVEGVLHVPGTPPVKLDSQDLLQMGDKQFYFLLPSRSIFETARIPRQPALPALPAPRGRPGPADYRSGSYGDRLNGSGDDDDEEDEGKDEDEDENEEEEEEEEEEEDGEEMEEELGHAVFHGTGKRSRGASVDGRTEGPAGRMAKGGPSGHLVKKSEIRSKADREADDQQLLLLEENDVISTVATVLSDLCGPGEWMPMDKLHAELPDIDCHCRSTGLDVWRSKVQFQFKVPQLPLALIIRNYCHRLSYLLNGL
ncbi:FHA domain-containing protein FHA2-like isoform X2 [Phoenix dactylifera]|uniref:FHA domain-containing protein FHA2-like isoform X2 n=1 Tax=Phoenix dactylifera TaxID=42345 RepID=A0A8B9AKU8_PHODC|nr:FHA domain-containing protein FHA2-like isoform X2 [Phoenix dactylifera]